MAIEFDEEGEVTNPDIRDVSHLIYKAIGDNWEIDFEGGYYDAAEALLGSEWLRIKLRDAWDEGATRAGRYGHEDSWDDEINPFNDNPYRTEDEKEY